jgi:hypothetical protein
METSLICQKQALAFELHPRREHYHRFVLEDSNLFIVAAIKLKCGPNQAVSMLIMELFFWLSSALALDCHIGVLNLMPFFMEEQQLQGIKWRSWHLAALL